MPDLESREFYADYGRPEVERLARAICIERGLDPETLSLESGGYRGLRQIPLWWKYQDDAISFLACYKASVKFKII